MVVLSQCGSQDQGKYNSIAPQVLLAYLQFCLYQELLTSRELICLTESNVTFCWLALQGVAYVYSWENKHAFIFTWTNTGNRLIPMAQQLFSPIV